MVVLKATTFLKYFTIDKTDQYHENMIECCQDEPK